MDIQTVIDKQAITDLQVDYSFIIDSGKYDDLERIFLPDVVADYGHAGQHTGLDTIKATCADALDHLDGVQHQNGNHLIKVDGDQATGSCYFTVNMVREGVADGEHFAMGGRYDDELVRTADGWRIARRTLTIEWRSGNPVVRFGE